MDCAHQRAKIAELTIQGQKIPLYRCEVLTRCVATNAEKALTGGAEVAVCEGCPLFQPAPPKRQPMPQQEKKNFCYFTGTNRASDNRLIASMIASARLSGVTEDFHVFSPTHFAAKISVNEMQFPGAIHHPIDEGYSWRDHMAKLDFLSWFAHTEYDYAVWLDSDTYFVRHPGDFSGMLRANPLWVAMESSTTDPAIRQPDWYGVSYPEITAQFIREGVRGPTAYTSNGGMWIVRHDDIGRVVVKANELYNKWHTFGWRNAPDEMVLACLGAMWVDDPQLNTTEATWETWACDWVGRYSGKLPDGNPWLYEDWVTGKQSTINPAIVHAMRSKDAMSADSAQVATVVDITPQPPVPWSSMPGGQSPVAQPANTPTMDQRRDDNLAVYPCKFRKDFLRIERRNGSCALSDSPCYTCELPDNPTGEASLWPFCKTQAMPACSRCEQRVE